MTQALDPGERRLAHFKTEGAGPAVVFLCGYASDMTGTKAVALEQWARAKGRAYLRFDYGGCGASAGAFEDQTLADWRDDALAMIDRHTDGPVILVGSSMGGWVMLLAALVRPDRVCGMVGIAAAPDFTDWGFTDEAKAVLQRDGRLVEPSPYSDAPTVFTRDFWISGEANRLLDGPIALDMSARLIHGQQDPDVPWEHSIRLAGLLRSADVQTWLIKDGDHRLSRDPDIATILRAIEELSH